MNAAAWAAVAAVAAAGGAAGIGARALGTRALRARPTGLKAPDSLPAQDGAPPTLDGAPPTLDSAAPAAAALPAVITAAIFAALWLRYGPSPLLPALYYLVAVGVALGFIDARHKRLPDLLTLPSYPAALLLVGVAAAAMQAGLRHLLYALIGMAAAWLFFVLQAFIYPAGIGWGDVKLSGVLGLYLGWFGAGAVLGGLLGGYLLAAVAGIGLLVAGRATRKSQVPFGPFLLASTLLVILVR